MSGKRFRIAFSFAGENRDFVSQVAGLLARRFGEAAILYDKYHQAEFSRSDLAFHLGDLVRKRGRPRRRCLLPRLREQGMVRLGDITGDAAKTLAFNTLEASEHDFVNVARFDKAVDSNQRIRLLLDALASCECAAHH